MISNKANYVKYNYFLDNYGIDNVMLRLWKCADFRSRHTVGVADDDIMHHILVIYMSSPGHRLVELPQNIPNWITWRNWIMAREAASELEISPKVIEMYITIIFVCKTVLSKTSKNYDIGLFYLYDFRKVWELGYDIRKHIPPKTENIMRKWIAMNIWTERNPSVFKMALISGNDKQGALMELSAETNNSHQTPKLSGQEIQTIVLVGNNTLEKTECL